MRHSSLLQITILTAVLAVGPLAGCTAIGYLIGSQVDKGRDKKIESLGGPQEIQTVKPGTAVELQLHDGRVLRGRYQGLDWAITQDYASRYEDARRDLGPGVELPALGPRARLALTLSLIHISEPTRR